MRGFFDILDQMYFGSHNSTAGLSLEIDLYSRKKNKELCFRLVLGLLGDIVILSQAFWCNLYFNIQLSHKIIVEVKSLLLIRKRTA